METLLLIGIFFIVTGFIDFVNVSTLPETFPFYVSLVAMFIAVMDCFSEDVRLSGKRKKLYYALFLVVVILTFVDTDPGIIEAMKKFDKPLLYTAFGITLFSKAIQLKRWQQKNLQRQTEEG